MTVAETTLKQPGWFGTVASVRYEGPAERSAQGGWPPRAGPRAAGGVNGGS